MKLKRNKVIQSAIEAIGAKTYLEIGTLRGRTLIPTKANKKIAVDVEFEIPWRDRLKIFWNTSLRRMTSDEYFRRYHDNFDVAFIDGLHTFGQSLRDAENCLSRLNPGGIIIFHDSNPASENMASPEPQPKGIAWTGEVWKTIVTLRTRPDLRVFVLDCDNGIGLVQKGNPEERLAYSAEEIKNFTYQDLEKNRKKFLNLKSPEYFDEFLKSLSVNPLVSIGLPTYNRASCLRRTLDSLLSQTYKNFELIVSDDASFDATGQICEEYAKRDLRLRYFRQSENLGAKENFYFVLDKANGKYFMRAGDDDWWDKNYIEKLVNALEHYREYAWALSSFARVYNNGEIEEQIIFSDAEELNKSSFEVFKRLLMRKRGYDHLVYGILKTVLFKKISERKPPDKGWDAILCAEMALAGKIYFIPEVLRFSNNKLENPYEKNSAMMPKAAKRLKKLKFPLVSTTYANLFFYSFWRGLTSRAVAFSIKFFIIIPWLTALFSKRKKFFGFLYIISKRNNLC